MVIDGDTHISLSRDRHGQNAVELVATMDESGVDMAVTWLHPLSNGSIRSVEDLRSQNENVYESVRRFPDRLIGFGWVDPTLGLQTCRDEIVRCIQDFGLRGIKMHGGLNTYFIDDPRISMPIVEEIARRNVVLALHCGSDAPDETHPFRIGKIAQEYPSCPILMVHGGGVAWNNLNVAATEIAKKHQNIYIVGSTLRTRSILATIQEVGAKRVCYGSDCPFSLMYADIASWKAILDHEVSPPEKDLILGGNLQRLFDLAE